jgi:MFS family permease
MNSTSIDDLRELIGVDYEKFSRAFISKSAGMLVGSFLAGPIADTFPAKMDVILAVSMTVMSGAALVLPLCPSLPVMGLSFCLQGVGQAALSASAS